MNSFSYKGIDFNFKRRRARTTSQSRSNQDKSIAMATVAKDESSERSLMSQLEKILISVVSKPPDQRTKTEIMVIMPWLRKKSSQLLSKLEDSVLLKLIRRCEYEKVYRDHVIIKQGDRGNRFYIMLSGKTSIYIDPVKSQEVDAPPPSEEEEKKQALSAHQAVLEEWDREEETEKKARHAKRTRLDRSTFGRFIGNFGKCFGEIALMSEDATRNASIIADEETDLLVIHRDLFNSTIKEKQEEEYKERKDFIARCSLFKNWNPKFKRLLEMSVRKESYHFGSPIVRQGEPVQGLHFITKGQAKVTIDPDAHKLQFSRLFDDSNNALARELGTKFIKKEEKVKESVIQEQIRVRRREGYAAAERRLANKTCTLCFVDDQEILGDIEYVLGLETYTQSFICTANTDLFILDNKNIERLLYKKNTHTNDMLRDIVENKVKSRRKTQSGCEIELYKRLLDQLIESRPNRREEVIAQLESEALAAKEAQNRTIQEKVNDKDLMVSQLIKLFLLDKSPLIEPTLPGAVYYRCKSISRAKRHLSAKLREKAEMEQKNSTGELRLQRARRAGRRQARSRRELERLTVAQDPEEMKHLQDKNHAVNRLLNQAGAVHGRLRPATSPGGARGLVPPATHVTPQRARSASNASGGERIFKLTEPDLPNDPDGDQVALCSEDVSSAAMQQIVLQMGGLSQEKNQSRAHIVCSLIDKQTRKNSPSLQTLMRPRSAPVIAGMPALPDDEVELGGQFDQETSNNVLTDLEERIRDFHEKHGGDNTAVRNTSQVAELRRFAVQGPENVPIPGGTVYVRQKMCKFTPGTYVNPSHHQHVRRFMIPRDAYAVATKSLTTVNQRDSTDGRPATTTGSAALAKQTKSQSARRAQSAPAKRRPLASSGKQAAITAW